MIRPVRFKKKSLKPRLPKNIALRPEIEAALEEIPSLKLQILYHSIGNVDISDHTTPLLTVGVWSFLESLTAACGRRDRVDFHSYLSSRKLGQLGLKEKGEIASVRDAVKRIAELGNSTKHHKTACCFHGTQLANDMETIGEILLALAREAKRVKETKEDKETKRVKETKEDEETERK